MAFHTTRATATTPSFGAELLSLPASPAESYRRLLAERHVLPVLFFSAVSGIYVAYVIAERMHLGDTLGFGPTVMCVVIVGAGLGLLALAFTVWVLSWSTRAAGGDADMEVLSGVFGYATWPFLPLLMLIVPIEFAAYGTRLFSANRPDPPTLVPIVTTALEAATILLWLYLMVRGEAVAAAITEKQAVRTLAMTFVRIAAIAILFVLISIASFMI